MSPETPPRRIVVYPTAGRCIYCGAAEGKLSDEHIVPYALGGTFVMKEASCRRCAAITGSFEGAVARSLFGNFRMKYGLPTRRPRERLTHIELDREHGGGKVRVPVEEFPAPAFMYKCLRAGILDGLASDNDISRNWQIVVLYSTEEMRAFQAKHGEDVVYKFRHVMPQFARTLAKVAHSFAVARLGPDAFRPLAVDLILGRSSNLSHVVGGSMDIQPAVLDAGHQLSLGILVKQPFVDEELHVFVVVELRLFAAAGTPSYHVVVGETSDPDAVMRLLAVLPGAETH